MLSDDLTQIDRFSMAILRLLASEPLRSYYQREVARIAGVSVGKTNQVLRRLEKDELLSRERRGNVDLYSYNLGSPPARYLKIFFNLSEVEGLRRRLRGLSSKVILFGSCAEGTDSRESDIDILVVAGDKEAAEKTVRKAESGTRRKISPVILTPLEFSGLKEKDQAFYEQVNKGITLWEPEE
jgi:predicted nucleotidyltransferase